MNRMVIWGIGFIVLIGHCVISTSQVGAQEKAKKYALLIGVNQYEHGKLQTLKYAVNDVVETGTILEKHGYNVIYLSDSKGKSPTKANIEAAINGVIENFQSGDTLIIGLAGHGLQYPGTKDCYFCPKDARPFKDETKTLVSLGSIWSRLEKTYSGTKLVIIDACRDDGSGIRGGGDEIPLPPKGVGVLLSCSDGQFAREHATLQHGLFFYHIIEGLKGAAKDSETNEVTWDDLRKYVKRGVPKKVQELYGEDSGVKQYPNEMGNLAGSPPVLVRIDGVSAKIDPKMPIKITPKTTPKVAIETEGAITSKTIPNLKLVRIKAGKFTMGAPKSEEGRKFDEDSRDITLSKDYYIGTHEVTQEQYEKVMGRNPSWFNRDRGGESTFPVEQVSWYDCIEFCIELSKKEGREPCYELKGIERNSDQSIKTAVVKFLDGKNGYRLPSEAEWEYACRAGTKTPFALSKTVTADEINYDGTSTYGDSTPDVNRKMPVPVGSLKKANAWGLYDMHGNIEEWCADYYGTTDKIPADGRPQTIRPTNNDYRSLRGGSYYSPAKGCRSGSRAHFGADSRYSYVGFRICLGTDE